MSNDNNENYKNQRKKNRQGLAFKLLSLGIACCITAATGGLALPAILGYVAGVSLSGAQYAADQRLSRRERDRASARALTEMRTRSSSSTILETIAEAVEAEEDTKPSQPKLKA